MTTAPEPAPMSEEELATFRRRANAHIPGSDHYTYSVDGIVYDGHFMHDARRLLDEIDRLRAQAFTHMQERNEYVTKKVHQLRGLNAKVDELTAELAETRRVADHNQAGLVKALDESAAENAALDAKLAVVSEGEPVCFAPLTKAGTTCGRTLPAIVPWSAARGDFDPSTGLTKRRSKTTCPECIAALGETGGTENG
jgi:hypothetical protein